MKYKVLELRPTQFAAGMREVGTRVQKILELKDSEIDNYLTERPVPIVLGPDNNAYIIDRHHHVRSCWEAGIKHVYVEIKTDLSKKGPAAFWVEMRAKHWLHPYDQFGQGPHDSILLPSDVRGLADDPYRSLAWQVRHDGGYKKTDALFSDFKWADFFRKRIKPETVLGDFDAAEREAVKLAASPEAKNLPGCLS